MFGKFIYEVVMYSSSYSGCDDNEGVGFPSIICIVLISGSYLVCMCVRVSESMRVSYRSL